MTLATDLLPQLQAYLTRRRPAGFAPPCVLTFLAQGEYNINYLLVDAAGRRAVARINVGTQIGKPGGEQIAYEAAALRLLTGTGVAPALYDLDDTLAELPYGLLLMEFLPGSPLRYNDARQIAAAARTLARLHQVRVPDGSAFIYRRALLDDLAEAQDWIAAYLACPRAPEQVRQIFTDLLAHAAVAAARDAAAFPAPFALAHTDVQAHNFIVEQQADATLCHLIDWERPLVDDPTYDLAHFLIPTTTRWKCGYSFLPAEEALFLTHYCAARPDLDPGELRERLRLRRPFILLRAICWCASAWVEYTGPGRAISNADTLARIEEYLQPAALHSLFAGWLES